MRLPEALEAARQTYLDAKGSEEAARLNVARLNDELNAAKEAHKQATATRRVAEEAVKKVAIETLID